MLLWAPPAKNNLQGYFFKTALSLGKLLVVAIFLLLFNRLGHY